MPEKKLRRFKKAELNISGTQYLTQFLWYAWPSHVGVASELLYLSVSEGAASDMTSDGLNKALA